MEVVVTSTEMQAYDRFAIDKLKIPGLLLMENAGRGVVQMMQKHLGPLEGKTILVLCGKGNNGGDGFVVARHLLTLKTKVIVFIISKTSDIKGDARTNYQALRGLAQQRSNGCSLELKEIKSVKSEGVLPKSDIIVDGLFGTGFKGGVRGIHAEVIELVNKSPAQKLSIDIPSGVNADTGEVETVAVKADLTVTMQFKKNGLIIGSGISYSGVLEVISIGYPTQDFNLVRHGTFLLSRGDIGNVLPSRPWNAHKHSVGKVFVLAGSKGLTGAAAMASISTLRAGAGAVILGTPRSIYPVMAKRLTEVMIEPLPETHAGSLSLNSFESIQEKIAWADVLVLGPGLSRNAETQQLIRRIVAGCKKPMLLDADALNALAEKNSMLKKHKSPDVIITPHAGELSRLIGKNAIEIEKNRVETSRKVAKEFGVTLVLKGAPTVTSSEHGEVYINSTGNAGMATAGSGDVLSGIIAGLWAQGMSRLEAAYAGVFVHGYAGDLAKKKFGERSLMATDIQELLPDALTEIERALNRC